MNMLDGYRLQITPFSPVHIGTGESYEPTNYVIEDGVLYEFDTGTAMRAFTEADRKQLLAIANNTPDVRMIEAAQRFFYERRYRLMAQAVRHVSVLPGVAKFYAQRIGQGIQQETNGQRVINRLEIDRTAYVPTTSAPVLFGSSIKGAIRTALLDKINNGDPAKEEKGLHEFQGRLFKYRDPERGRLFFERDPLRLIRLADALWAAGPHGPATQVLLAVNRKKVAIKDASGRARKSHAESGDLYQILECLPPWRYRAFAGQVTVQDMAGLERRDPKALPAADRRFDMTYIARACNDFYAPILEGEMRMLRERGYLDEAWAMAADRLLMESHRKRQQGLAFVLRVGRHSGAESVTLNGARRITIKERGQKEASDAAKTWWLAAMDKDQRQNLLPFGWLLVEIYPEADDSPAWPELQAICEPYMIEARRLAGKLTVKLAEIEEARHEAEARRLVKEEEERRRAAEHQRQAEMEAQRQAQRQTQLAALTPFERGIEEFLDRRPDRNQSEISAVIAAAKQGRWRDDERLAVAIWLKTRMQATKGEWKEVSQAKKPAKDREYQNTLLVKSWLDGKW